jgi:hypothetical protein
MFIPREEQQNPGCQDEMKHTADTLRNVDARSEGDTAGDDDGGGAGRERDAGVVGGRGGLERDASTELSGDRVGVGDSARCEHGACDVHGTGSGGAHGMRGDAVGVGDIDEVPGGARSAGDTAGDDDGGGAGREYHTSNRNCARPSQGSSQADMTRGRE